MKALRFADVALALLGLALGVYGFLTSLAPEPLPRTAGGDPEAVMNLLTALADRQAKAPMAAFSFGVALVSTLYVVIRSLLWLNGASLRKASSEVTTALRQQSANLDSFRDRFTALAAAPLRPFCNTYYDVRCGESPLLGSLADMLVQEAELTLRSTSENGFFQSTIRPRKEQLGRELSGLVARVVEDRCNFLNTVTNGLFWSRNYLGHDDSYRNKCRDAIKAGIHMTRICLVPPIQDPEGDTRLTAHFRDIVRMLDKNIELDDELRKERERGGVDGSFTLFVLPLASLEDYRAIFSVPGNPFMDSRNFAVWGKRKGELEEASGALSVKCEGSCYDGIGAVGYFDVATSTGTDVCSQLEATFLGYLKEAMEHFEGQASNSSPLDVALEYRAQMRPLVNTTMHQR